MDSSRRRGRQSRTRLARRSSSSSSASIWKEPEDQARSPSKVRLPSPLATTILLTNLSPRSRTRRRQLVVLADRHQRRLDRPTRALADLLGQRAGYDAVQGASDRDPLLVGRDEGGLALHRQSAGGRRRCERCCAEGGGTGCCAGLGGRRRVGGGDGGVEGLQRGGVGNEVCLVRVGAEI